jgi:hypothetical protein
MLARSLDLCDPVIARDWEAFPKFVLVLNQRGQDLHLLSMNKELQSDAMRHHAPSRRLLPDWHENFKASAELMENLARLGHYNPATEVFIRDSPAPDTLKRDALQLARQLAIVFGLEPCDAERVLREEGFVLTPDFLFKMLNVWEKMQACVPTILVVSSGWISSPVSPLLLPACRAAACF